MPNSVQDLKSFITSLSEKLVRNGDGELGSALLQWRDSTFTTASELLGELYLILIKVRDSAKLQKQDQITVEECINEIKEAFRRVGSKIGDPPRK